MRLLCSALAGATLCGHDLEHERLPDALIEKIRKVIHRASNPLEAAARTTGFSGLNESHRWPPMLPNALRISRGAGRGVRAATSGRLARAARVPHQGPAPTA